MRFNSDKTQADYLAPRGREGCAPVGVRATRASARRDTRAGPAQAHYFKKPS